MKAVWPGRAAKTQETLEVLRANPDALRNPNPKLVQSAFEVRLVRGRGARFAGAKTFIDDLEASVVHFYAEVGQRLKNWQPAAPKMLEKPNQEALTEPSELDSQDARNAGIRDDADDAV